MTQIYDPIIHDHILKELNKYTLNQMLTLNSLIENVILEKVEGLLLSILETEGIKKIDKEFLVDNNNVHYRYSMQIDIVSRCCSIDITSLSTDTNKLKYRIDEDVNNFGKIRSITVFSPANKSKLADFIMLNIQVFLISAYSALEFIFKTKINELDYAIFNQLYDAINTDLELNSKHDLVNKFWFGVHADNAGLYFFDKNVMKDLIKKYKENQVSYNSPYELISYIITEPVPTDQSLAKESFNSGEQITKKFSETIYQLKAPHTYIAEKLMFGSDSLSIYAILEVRGYMLAVGYPTDYADEFKYIFDRNVKTLEYLFILGMKEWSPFIHKFKDIKLINEDTIISRKTGEFTGGLIGALIQSLS